LTYLVPYCGRCQEGNDITHILGAGEPKQSDADVAVDMICALI